MTSAPHNPSATEQRLRAPRKADALIVIGLRVAISVFAIIYTLIQILASLVRGKHRADPPVLAKRMLFRG